MKQAFLICAYNNPDYLSHFISTLDSERSEIYVHIDKNQESNFTDFFAKYKQVDNVHVYSEIPCRYCGIGIVKSIAFLISEALKDNRNQYFHFLSGQDILLKPFDAMLNFFEENRSHSFLSYWQLPKQGWGTEGGYEKFRYYWLNDKLTCNDSHKWNKRLNKLVVGTQLVLKIRRKPLPFEKMYGCSAWWSVNRDAAVIFDEFFAQESNWTYISNTYIPDEYIFSTILCNSRLKDTLINNNYRYIRFVKTAKKTSHPQTMTAEDYSTLVESGNFFARKIDPKASGKLIEMLDHHIGYVGNQ